MDERILKTKSIPMVGFKSTAETKVTLDALKAGGIEVEEICSQTACADGKKFYESKRCDINLIVDRVGSGDSFSTGLVHGLFTYKNKQNAVEFAVATSALKHTIPGDFNQVSIKEAETLMKGGSSGRVSC